MAIGARLSGLWASYQAVIWLVVALGLSAALNVWQWKRAITAPLRGEIAARDRALDDSAEIQKALNESAGRLQAAADAAAAQLDAAGTDYRAAMRARPLTRDNCAPGQPRMDATNRALGANPE